MLGGALLLLFAVLCAVGAGAPAGAPAALPTVGRLAGGVDITGAEAPFLVRVENGAYCSGSLITRRWVLFAAHCRVQPNGIADLYGGNRSVARIVRHPDFDPQAYTIIADVALAELTAPAPLQARTLPLARDESAPRPGVSVTMYGIGARDEENHGMRERRRAGARTLREEDCKDKMEYQAWREALDYEMHVCVNDEKLDAGICNGDSGGPLVAFGRQVAIASYRLGKCASAERPDVFTRTAPYVPWMEKVIGHALPSK